MEFEREVRGMAVAEPRTQDPAVWLHSKNGSSVGIRSCCCLLMGSFCSHQEGQTCPLVGIGES